MILGFTGTSRGNGMTSEQSVAVRRLLVEGINNSFWNTTIVHHGDCVGADSQFHDIALSLRFGIVIHPPTDPRKRAFCADRHLGLGFSYLVSVRKEYRYLTRNRHIVLEGVDGLIAAPRSATEPVCRRGEGTWTTVGYARKAGRHIWLVMPDGTIREEAGAGG